MMISIRMPETATVREVAEQCIKHNLPAYTNGLFVEITNCPQPGFYPMGIKMRDSRPLKVNNGGEEC